MLGLHHTVQERPQAGFAALGHSSSPAGHSQVGRLTAAILVLFYESSKTSMMGNDLRN